MPVAAYMALARERGAEIVTPLAAEAMPSGPVREDAYERMAGLICDAVAGGCDAALLDLHGAMVAEHVLDGEGELLRRVRHVAPDLPVAITCDLHCNLTAAMVENCTALIGYKTYPHVDMYEVAERIGRVVLDAVDGRVEPVMSWGRVDLLSQTLCQGTDDEPMRSLVAMCRKAEAREGVLAATVFGGFALADIPDAGNSAVVVTDGDRRLADEIRDDLLDRMWAGREAFVYRHRPIEEALDEARAFDGGPVILLDHADNCGSGATQDVMTAIEAVMRAGLEDVVVGAVWDPEAVTKMRTAGVGAEVELDLGGRTDMPGIGEAGRPLRGLRHGPRADGTAAGRCAARCTPECGSTWARARSSTPARCRSWSSPTTTSRGTSGCSPRWGIQPQHHRYILLKSRIHYRAGFGDLPKLTLTLDGTGVTTSDNDVLRYRRLRRPIYPLDRINRP